MQTTKYCLSVLIVMFSTMAFGHTNVCQSVFTSGSGPSFFQFCVTVNGNITEFQSPLGFEHIREGSYNEGYGICDFTAPGLARYYDWADGGDSGNWQPPVSSQPGGPNTFPLTITRTTSDGNWTLTQSFSRNPGELLALITMTLKNNSGISRDFSLLRYADVDANNANGGTFNNEFDFDHESAWGYNNGFNLYGVMLYTFPTTVPHFAFVQNTANPPDPCSPVANLPSSTPFFGDGSVGFDWNGSSLKPGAFIRVTGKYKRF